MRDMIKGAVIAAAIFICMLFVGIVDGGAEAGVYPHDEMATVQVVVTLECGNTYVVSEKEKKVTVNTYGSKCPKDWDISNWR